MLTFVHTADVHLGQPLHRIAEASGPDAAARLRQLRLEAIDRIGALAREREAAFVVIAGDLFDGGLVDDRTLVAACEHLAAIPVAVFVLPGNHDLSGLPGGAFGRAAWTREKPSNVTVLSDRQPRWLPEHNAVILPAPADPDSPADPTAHLLPELGLEHAGAFRIGLAHGGVTDFAQLAGGRSATIPPNRAQVARLDVLALGDWHGFQQPGERTVFCGSPEPTQFATNDSGNVAVIRLRAPGEAPEIERVRIARSRWLLWQRRVRDGADAERLAEELAALEAPRDTLLRLELDAVVTAPVAATLDGVLKAASARLLHLRLRAAGGGAYRPQVLPDPVALEEAAAAAPAFVEAAIAELRADPDEPDAVAALLLLERLLAEAGSTC